MKKTIVAKVVKAFDHAKAARKAWRLHRAIFAKAVIKMVRTRKAQRKLALAA